MEKLASTVVVYPFRFRKCLDSTLRAEPTRVCSGSQGIELETGEILSTHVIDPTKTYWRNQQKPGPIESPRV